MSAAPRPLPFRAGAKRNSLRKPRGEVRPAPGLARAGAIRRAMRAAAKRARGQARARAHAIRAKQGSAARRAGGGANATKQEREGKPHAEDEEPPEPAMPEHAAGYTTAAYKT